MLHPKIYFSKFFLHQTIRNHLVVCFQCLVIKNNAIIIIFKKNYKCKRADVCVHRATLANRQRTFVFVMSDANSLVFAQDGRISRVKFAGTYKLSDFYL